MHKYSFLTVQRASFERDREYYSEKRERSEALREQVDFLTCNSLKVCVQKSILSRTNDPLYKSVLSRTERVRNIRNQSFQIHSSRPLLAGFFDGGSKHDIYDKIGLKF